MAIIDELQKTRNLSNPLSKCVVCAYHLISVIEQGFCVASRQRLFDNIMLLIMDILKFYHCYWPLVVCIV